MLFDSKVPAMMNDAFKKYWLAVESVRVTRARDMLAWFENDRDGIITQVRRSLSTMFRPKTVRRMQVRVFNVVPRVVNRLAKLYAEPPVRELDGGVTYDIDETTGERTPLQSKSDVVFQEMLKRSTIDRRMKEAERRALYFNTVLIQPRYIERPDDAGGPYMDFVVHTPAFTVVEWDEMNHQTPTAFYFPAYRTIDGATEQVLVYWSADEHYYIRRNNVRVPVPGMKSMANPYDVLPAAVYRIVESNDGWGNGMWDLVDGNIECCEQVTNIAYTAKFQAHGQPVAVNMGIKGEVDIGPDRVLTVDDRTGGTPPSFSFANANPAIAEVQGLVDWMLRTLQNIRGISGSSMSLDATVQSGVSKIQDAVELTESRKDMVTIATEFEHDLFRVTRAVWNYHAKQRIEPSAEFTVKFKEPEPFKSVDEKIKEREFGLKNNVMSYIDIIKQDNPQMDDQQAAERFDQIVAERRRLADKYGFFDGGNTTPGTPDDNTGNENETP